MASYQKYVMMGVSTLLLPLAMKIIKKLISKYSGESEEDSTNDGSEDFIHTSRWSDNRAG